MSDNCYRAIADPICCADGGVSGSGVLDTIDDDTTYADGNMIWTTVVIDSASYWLHPCIDSSDLTTGQTINYEAVTVPYQSDLGIVKATQ